MTLVQYLVQIYQLNKYNRVQPNHQLRPKWMDRWMKMQFKGLGIKEAERELFIVGTMLYFNIRYLPTDTSKKSAKYLFTNTLYHLCFKLHWIFGKINLDMTSCWIVARWVWIFDKLCKLVGQK